MGNRLDTGRVLLQAAVAVLPSLALPTGKAAASLESLKVHDDSVGPRHLHIRMLKGLHVVAAPVERQDQRDSSAST